MLPKNEPVINDKSDKVKIWVYGPPFSGKTTFADTFPNPLMLNTDGNTKFVKAPRLRVRDQVKTTGRLVNKKLAWVYFKELIDELEKKDNDFETIVLDLYEDYYQFCRIYVWDREKVTHESDAPFKMWDMVTTEFLNEITRLLTLDYNIVLLSHQDLSRDITKMSGSNITQIKPNLRDKVAIKTSGMVDLVGRIEVDEKGGRKLQFKQDAVTFGGYRLPVFVPETELSYEAIVELYNMKGA